MKITEILKFNTKYQLIILAIIAFCLNANTLFNEYAYDDYVVITENKIVEKGINGIPELLTTQYFAGVSINDSALAGARYRPLSLIIFALEHQLFGENAIISHLINILLYTLLAILLYKFLTTIIFRDQHKYLAFVSCMIFIVHPIHTEIVANVKGRDELLTFIFLLSCFLFFAKYLEKKYRGLLAMSLLTFFLALLTKESAVTSIAIVPLLAYFFLKKTLKESFFVCLPYIFTFFTYMFLRYCVVGAKQYEVADIGNTPYIFAATGQAFATKIYILFKYIVLLCIPTPLSYDYSYNQIPYVNLISTPFIISLLLLTSLIIYSFIYFKRKSIVSFSILYFFVTISIGTNLFIDLGTPLAERMLFQPSLAFCIALAVLLIRIFEKNMVLSGFLFFTIVLLFSVKTFARNSVWKNNETLFLTDVATSPNSIRTNQNALQVFISKGISETDLQLKKQYFKKAVSFGEQSLKICPDNQLASLNLESAYIALLDNYESTSLFLKDFNLSSTNKENEKKLNYLSNLFYRKGNELFDQNFSAGALKCFKLSVELNNSNLAAWYYLGGGYYFKGDTVNANKTWNTLKKLDSTYIIDKNEFSVKTN